MSDISVLHNFVGGRWVAAALFVLAAGIAQPAGQTAGYLVAVASEAADKLTFVRFAGAAARIESEIDTGIMPTDIDGPHGLAGSPDGKFLYVSLAHGQPNGAVLKYSTATRAVVGRVVQADQRITSATPSADGLSVRLVVDALVLGHIHELHLPGVRDRTGQPLLHDVAYYTLNQIPKR